MRALLLAAVLVATTALALPTTAAAAPGDLDTSWDGDGIREDPSMSGEDVVVQPDGKVITASSFDGGLFRYNAGGTPDTSFDGDGFLGTNQGVRALVLQSDGKIVVTGGFGDFWVARFNPDGSADTSFDGDGEVFADFGGFDDPSGITIDSGGRIVAVGATGGDFAIARFTSSGAPDTTFDTDGLQTVDFGGSDRAWDVVVQSNGRVVATGDSDGDFALAGLTGGGALDATFGSGGRRTTDFGGSEGAFGSALAGEDRIVVAGHRNNAVFAVARYAANGDLDASCDGDGTFETSFGTGFTEGRDVAVQTNGRFVVTGVFDGDIATARFEPDDCALETTFSGDGKVVTQTDDGAQAVAINPESGRILLAGSRSGEPPDQFVAALQGDPRPAPPPDDPPPPDPCANDRSGPTVTIRSLQETHTYRRGQSPASVRIEASDPSGLASDPSDPARAISTAEAGVFTVTATARDNCNNETTTTFRYRVAAPPAIQVGGVSASCTASNFLARIRVRGDVLTTSITARLNGRLLGSARNSASLTVRVPARTLKAGRYTLVVAARDRAGNRSTRRVSFARCVVVEPSFTG